MAATDNNDIDDSFDDDIGDMGDLGDMGEIDDTFGDLNDADLGDLDDTNFDENEFDNFDMDNNGDLDGLSKENMTENDQNHNKNSNNKKERSVSQSIDVNVKDEGAKAMRNDKKDEAEDLEEMQMNAEMKAKEQRPESEVSSVASMAMPSSGPDPERKEKQSNTKSPQRLSMTSKLQQMQNQSLLGNKRRFASNGSSAENTTDSRPKRRKRESISPVKSNNFQISLNRNQDRGGMNGLMGSGTKQKRLSLDSNSSFSSTTARRGSLSQDKPGQLRLNGLGGLLSKAVDVGNGATGQQEQMKDDPLDLDMLLNNAQQKMDRIYSLWQQAKTEYAQKRKEIEEEFEKSIDLKLMTFGQDAQTQLQELSEAASKNSSKRQEIGRTAEMLNNQPTTNLLQ